MHSCHFVAHLTSLFALIFRKITGAYNYFLITFFLKGVMLNLLKTGGMLFELQNTTFKNHKRKLKGSRTCSHHPILKHSHFSFCLKTKCLGKGKTPKLNNAKKRGKNRVKEIENFMHQVQRQPELAAGLRLHMSQREILISQFQYVLMKTIRILRTEMMVSSILQNNKS